MYSKHLPNRGAVRVPERELGGEVVGSLIVQAEAAFLRQAEHLGGDDRLGRAVGRTPGVGGEGDASGRPRRSGAAPLVGHDHGGRDPGERAVLDGSVENALQRR